MRVSAATRWRSCVAATSLLALSTACAELASVDAWPAGAASVGGSGGLGGDAGGAAGGGDEGAGACSSLTVLHDDFAVDRGDWTFAGEPTEFLTYIDSSAGELRVELPPVTAGSGYARSVRAYNLAGSSLAVRFLHRGAAPGSVAGLRLVDAHGGFGRIDIWYQDGAITADVHDRENETFSGGSTQDEGYQYFHVTESQGTIHFGASTDGVRVEEIGSVAVPPDGSVDRVHVQLRGEQADVSEGGFVAFDDLNDPASSPAGALCAASRIEDGFDDDTTHPMWHEYAVLSECDAREVSGVLLVTPGLVPGFCGYHTWVRLRLTDEGVRVQAPLDLRNSESYAWLALASDPQNEVSIGVYQNALHCTTRINGMVEDYSVSYDPPAHAFWKIHAADDKIFWSASIDGTIWHEVHSVDATLELSDMELRLIGGNAFDVAEDPVVRFDLLNLDPE